MSLEWTPEAVKAEVDYRQWSMRADAEHVREVRRTTPRKESWWTRLARLARSNVPEPRKAQGNAA
ncbi:hypothetical protein ACFFQW_48820 [Umezawaea endophytica]|uniref:Uncharacterized protein n=1 Tax=Umezawaea endophytica TaxID=1654476 RepID=A0A9X2VKK6_9PSEU|nr:hypothetical protein [Umezawaea endophytica]MCS7478241.1 hypothetical protein [Umezawaea endophytica]